MIESLEDAVLVLYRALEIRDIYRAEPDPDDPEVSPTEESVLTALRESGEPRFIALRDRYTRAARLMVQGVR